MLDKPAAANETEDGRPAARFPGASRAARSRRAAGALDRAVNKDTELHPLVRWQFQGGLAEDQRRAFLFTNVVDAERPPLRHSGRGRRAGGLGAHLCLGMGRPVEEIETAWMNAIAHPIAPVTVASPPCQEVVITGDDLRQPNGGLKTLPVPVSTPGFDAAPYLTATLCITQDPETGVRNMGTYRAALKATDRLGVRMAARIGGAGGYLHWQKYRKLKTADADRHRGRLRAGGDVHRPAEARHRPGRDGGRGRACRRADPHCALRHASISTCRRMPRSWSRD